MTLVSYTFTEVASTATYQIACGTCGKLLKRTAKVFQTINPFNKNAAGEVKTRSEIVAQNHERLPAEIERLKAKGATCKGCKERPYRSLLLWFDGDLEKPFAQERMSYWNSPAHWLVDRGHLREAYDEETREAKIFYLTPAGKARAAKFSPAERADLEAVHPFEPAA